MEGKDSTLDDYKIITTIATGTFGKVFLVTTKDGKAAALKSLKKSQVIELR